MVSGQLLLGQCDGSGSRAISGSELHIRGIGQLGRVEVGLIGANETTVEHLVLGVVETTLEEVDGSRGVADIHVIVVGVKHLGVLQLEYSRGLVCESLESSNVVHGSGNGQRVAGRTGVVFSSLLRSGLDGGRACGFDGDCAVGGYCGHVLIARRVGDSQVVGVGQRGSCERLTNNCCG